jgi:hypothetical protein
MKLDAEEIGDLVKDTEQKRSQWSRAADAWEDAWKMASYTKSRFDSIREDGEDKIVSPDTFNVIQLLQRFVADDMRVEIPSLTGKDDDDERSEKLEEFLVAFDRESNRQQGCNHVRDAVWQSGVLGRGAAQVLWIGDVLPTGVPNRTLPIWRRKLDPRNVGVGRGPYWTDYAYHKYKTTRSDIEQRYPKFQFDERDTKYGVTGYYDDKYEVVDFWCLHKGAIWHGVVIDDKFAKPMYQTDYPDIPIVEWYADGAPVDDELLRSLSIIHPIYDLWKLKNDLMSKVATGLMYHYDPLIIAKGFNDKKDIDLGPGQIAYINPNQELDMFRPEPNVPMAQNLLGMVQQGIDQATFPSVMYGENSGVQSGYAVNSLAQQAKSRANTIRDNIEAAIEQENQLVLGLIEAFGGDEGVEIYGRSQQRDRGGPLRINKDDIKGNYSNHVILTPESPMDDNARIMAWLQLYDRGIASKETIRNRVINISMPRDEETRISVERALESPELAQKKTLRSLQERYKQDEWELIIAGTPLQQVWEQERQFIEQRKEERRRRREQSKAERNLEELAASLGITPDMLAAGSAPVDPSMMGMPPGSEMMGDPAIMGGMPPQGPPGGEMMPPDGMPMVGGDMQPQGLPGVPPGMAGQMTPEMLGIGPGAPLGMFDQMMGRGEPTEGDILDALIPGGPPPV